MPKTPSAKSKFFKAVSSAGEETTAYIYTEAIVYAKGGVALQSPDGSYWQLTVDNSGNLSTTKITDVPEGVSQ